MNPLNRRRSDERCERGKSSHVMCDRRSDAKANSKHQQKKCGTVIQARHGAKLGSVHMELCALTKSIQLKVIHQLYLDPSLNKRSRNVCSERGRSKGEVDAKEVEGRSVEELYWAGLK